MAITLGGLNTLSFAPSLHGGWLELAIFAGTFWVISHAPTLRAALLAGGIFGFGQFVSGIWWLYVSMHFYGHMPALIAGAAVILFSLYLALYPALSVGLWHVCCAPFGQRTMFPSWHASMAFACAWALGEWLRGTIFTGFPWLVSGYAQVDGPLAGFAPLIGVYGVSWVLALVGALIIQTVMNVSTERGVVAWLMPASVVVGLIVSGILLSRVTWTQPSGPALSVRLLQGNIKQSIKFDQIGIRHALATYQRLITEKPADLVVTPETAIPLPLYETPTEFRTTVQSFVDATHTSVLFGAVGVTITKNGGENFTNALYGITPESSILYRYDKHHLVPFGEFIPWGFQWFVDIMRMPLGNFARGRAIQPPFIVRGQSIAPSICYEDTFGEEIAYMLRSQLYPATMLINSTNLGWFGNTIALDHYLQIARMRSLETGRPMLHATNTGVTAIIDSDGLVKAQLHRFTVGALDVNIQGRSGMTPYILTGNITVLIISIVGLAIGRGIERHTCPSRYIRIGTNIYLSVSNF
ncbi:apolipoprotein N-acyltransferase [Candidatus Vallotia cooleyia]|uniref:apolipoprotein N-acyltransferase n=1 Tax=Candidatus Vallotiella adelgis TaxID=1177211 RepID=UPI001D0261FD|nr:apolipoprotein N-acyltransferase [Candidatus Vallotia cooleyia]